MQWYVICAGYSHLSTGEVLVLQMETFRSYLLANTLASDREELFYLVLRGVDEGIMKVRRGWSKEKKHEQYMQVSWSSPQGCPHKHIVIQVMEAVTLFTDIVQFPDLRSLNFGEVPRTIRFKIYNMIPHFTQLRVLIIGPGGSLSNQGSSWIPIKVHAAR